MVTKFDLKDRAEDPNAMECVELRIWVRRGSWVDLARRLTKLAAWALIPKRQGRIVLGKPWWLDKGIGNWGGDSGP